MTDLAVVPGDELPSNEVSDCFNEEAPVAECCICWTEKDDVLSKVTKGVKTLEEYCKLRSCDQLLSKIHHLEKNRLPIYVHKICRKDFTNARKSFDPTTQTKSCDISAHLTRSQIPEFNWNENCFFCGDVIEIDEKHPERSLSISQAEVPSKEAVLEICSKRNDEWGAEVEHRLCDGRDFVAAVAKYHRQCRSNFFNFREKIPSKNGSGRKVDDEMQQNFDRLCVWLEKEVDLFTVSELHQKMSSFSSGIDNVYGMKWFKEKLKKRYKDDIYFTDEPGRSSLVCFRDTAAKILNEENKTVIKSAVALLRKEIRSTKFDGSYYPSSADIVSGKSFLPPLLCFFMECMIPTSELKQAAIGQCLIKAMRPYNVIPPLLFALAVEIDHTVGSKGLINTASKLGYALGSEEIRRFKQSVASAENGEEGDSSDDSFLAQFLQWIADNADHNAQTLDGKDTFHLMGIIECGTYTTAPMPKRIKRIKEMLKSEDVVNHHRIKIYRYEYPEVRALSKLVLQPINDIVLGSIYSKISLNIDILWHTAGIFRQSERQGPRPSWNGYMDLASLGLAHPSKSTITTLPFIDLNPSDESCILSTIMYVIELARRKKIPTPCLTFDQPLWLKAVEIIKTKKLNIVVRLGGFHCLMSFAGSLGMVMEGSGLEKALETVYGNNTVTQMLGGKSISRALRGHFLVDSALKIKLITPILDSVDGLTEQEKRCLKDLFENTDGNYLFSDEVEMSAVLTKLRGLIERKIESLKDFRTAKLWVQYMNYIDVIKFFMRAERCGNWNDHLTAVSKMLNLFAAAGHYNYAKCARLYLQMMRNLKRDHPWLYEQFAVKGYHCVRRTDKYWAGLWTDLTIEQTLMRAIKSNGGLTRGRGMDESSRTLWATTLHKFGEIEQSMRAVTNTKRESSEQHVELGRSRRQRDFEDLQKILSWFHRFDPFECTDTRLRSLSSGLVAQVGDGINCDDAEEVGYEIQKRLDNQAVDDAKVKTSEKVKSLIKLSTAVKVDDKDLHIDPSVLFLRVILLVERADDPVEYFSYELTPVPTSLFRNKFMRKPAKSLLAKELISDQKKSNRGKKRKLDECDDDEDEEDNILPALPVNLEDLNMSRSSKHVVDGGALLHRIDWQTPSLVADLIKNAHHLLEKYDGPCTVVFDGYKQSTKDHEHKRRQQEKKFISPDMKVELDADMMCSREEFFSNQSNKVQFIKLLTNSLSEVHHVINCEGDADTQIVKEALDFVCEGREVTVVADDTDILVLLLHHWQPSMTNIYLRNEPKKNKPFTLVNIRERAKMLKPIVKDNLLFIHAWGGCDTTSATYGHGKIRILKLVQNQVPEVIGVCSTFNKENATENEIAENGSALFKVMYGGKVSDELADLRRLAFTGKNATCKTAVKPEVLPPTYEAARQHSLRVYLQVSDWKCLGFDTSLLPTKWGWYHDDSGYQPVMSSKQPVPDDILKVICCKCQSTSKNQCGTNKCSCRKNGVSCVSACGDCHGIGCNNSCVKQFDKEDQSVFQDDTIEEEEFTDGNIFEKLFSC